MKPPGPINEVEDILKFFKEKKNLGLGLNLSDKWINFMRYTIKKYKLNIYNNNKFMFINDRVKWSKWYIKKIKCEEILK